MINRNVENTEALTLEVYVHGETNYFDAASPQLIGSTTVANTVLGNSTIPVSESRLPLTLPTPGDYYVSLVLLEDGVIVDQVRSSGLVSFVDNLPVVSSGTGQYFVGDPSILIAGSTLTLTLPGVGNGTGNDQPLQIQVIATATPKLISAFVLIDAAPPITLEARAESAAEVINLEFTDPGPGFPFYHVLISSEETTHLVHTVESSESFNSLSFSEANVDYLTDSDGDGVADDNEILEGSDPNSAASTPGATVVDLLVVYNADVAALYGGDPGTRIDSLVAASNQAFSDSNVNMTINVVDSVQLGYASATSQATLLTQAENSTSVFSTLQTLRDAAAADLVVIFLPDDEAGTCSTATQGGFPTEGLLARRDHISVSVIDAADCDDMSMLHGIGHNMGLNHSFDSNASGTFVWARGHGQTEVFGTIMTLTTQFAVSERLPYFSNPAISLCNSRPCGVAVGQAKEANAAAALEAVRFQVGWFSGTSGTTAGTTPPPSGNDSDGDGVPDSLDAFPTDPSETEDTDEDGIGNNADTDDDNDGMPDEWELENDLNPLVDDADENPDEDSFTNLEEYNRGSDPQVFDPDDACDDPNITPPDSADSTLPIQKRLAMVNPGSNISRQSFLRFVNTQQMEANVEIYGVDDLGVASKNPPVSFVLPAESALQITSQDLENGNAAKGLDSNLCDLTGKWQLIIRSDQDIEIMGLIRSEDGFLTGMSEVAPVSTNSHQVYFANPASNFNQQSFVRIVNESSEDGIVTISGVDDTGIASEGNVTFSLMANRAIQLTSQDLENGNVGKGLTGSLGGGSGKWQLTVSSDLELAVMSLIRAPGGFLTNMSSTAPKLFDDEVLIPLVMPANQLNQQSFIRIINTSSTTATFTISATDETGNGAPNGSVQLTLAAGESRQMTATDLEQGNLDKGLSGFLGDGEGQWYLNISATRSFEAMALVRTPDGFVTNLSSVAQQDELASEILFVNPGSNINQQSSLRILNTATTQASVTISAFDDAGNAAPGGEVTFNLSAGESKDISAADLESGRSDLVGALGDGTGKWRVEVSSNVQLNVQSLLASPGGYITNLSEGVR